ncbi:hypothetical protein JL721_3537 [Aureococcus anophagefferens]|nr:hypothetical protein JL721_3537 [Aureococcus anophagefferens]
MRSLAKAVAKAAGVERVVLEADGGVLDGAAKVSAVLRDGQRLVARVPLDLPYDEFDVVVVDFGRAGSGAPSCSPEAPAWVCSRSDVERRAARRRISGGRRGAPSGGRRVRRRPRLPLRVDAADDAAPVAWRRPGAGEVVVLPDFVDEALARKIIAVAKTARGGGLMGDGGAAARPAASGYRSNRAAFLTDASGAGALALRTVTRVADGLGHRTLELRCVLPRAVKKATVAALEDAGEAFGVTFAMTPGMVRTASPLTAGAVAAMRVDSPMISYHSLEGGKSDRIMSVDCHPDASDGLVTFATVGGGGEGDVRLWSLAPDAEAPVYRSSLRKGHDGSVNCARWSPDGAKLCSAGDRGTVCVWSGQSTAAWWRGLDDRDERATCGHLSHSDDVYDVCWSPCGAYVLSGSIDGVVTIWHAEPRRAVKVVRDHAHYVQGVAWDPLGTCFATASSDRTVKVYALPDKWAASKKPLAPKTVRFWGDERARRRREKARKDAGDTETKEEPREGLFSSEIAHASFFRRLQFAADGTALRRLRRRVPVLFRPAAPPARRALLCHDAFAVHDVRSGRPLAVGAGGHYAALTDGAWAPDGSALILASADGYLSFARFDPGELGERAAPGRARDVAPVDAFAGRAGVPRGLDEASSVEADQAGDGASSTRRSGA